jgi:two-component system response regulator RegA
MSNLTDDHTDDFKRPPVGSKILIVDDSDPLRERLAVAFQDRGYVVSTATNYDTGIEEAKAFVPEYAVVDLKMPGKSGLDLLKDLVALFPDLKIVLMTGYGSITNAVDAIKLGAVNYVTKPADTDEILGAFMDSAETETPSQHLDFEPPTLAQAEWEHMQRVLAECGGNRSEAARVLGITRRTLQRKLKKRAP